MGKNWAGPVFPHPDLWKYQTCAEARLSGWRKTGLAHSFPTLTSESINLTLSWICKQPLLFRGWGKTGPAQSFPTPTSVSINLVQKLGYLGGEKLGQPILSPPRLVKVSTLPCHEYSNNLCFLGVEKNWAGPFFPHPDKIKHQPCAGGYLGREKLGWSVIFPPWQVKHQPHTVMNTHTTFAF